MIDIGVGLSLEPNPVSAATEALKQAKAKIHSKKIDLVLVVGTINLSYITLLKTIAGGLPGVPIVGTSSPAIISNQGIFKQGVLLFILSFPEDAYCKVAGIKDIKSKNGLKAGEELSAKLLQGLPNTPRTLSLILSNAAIEENTGLIYGLQERLGKSFPLIGAYMGGNSGYAKSHVYFNQELMSDACIGILLGGKLNFGLGIRHGFKPLGRPHLVTAAKDNLVEKIDGEPAVKLYEEYLGSDLARLKKDLKLISVFYPIGLTIEGEEEYLLRSLLSIEENGSLYFEGNIPQASTIRLMIGTKETCLEAAGLAIKEANKIITQATTEKDEELEGIKLNRLALVFSSLRRSKLLREQANQELEIIKDGLGQNTPIIGLYTYGELAPLKTVSYRGQTYYHNQAVSILVLEG